ncbi:MAG: polysaccharide deacetylase family protein [Crocinitomicaceae bacterium]|nr:polysaccharide deacetylase family protein [Crocinitomicaceae bacterium]
MRFFQIPKWSRIIYSDAIWDFFLKKNNTLYLTFDDGPCDQSTRWILDLLSKYNAKATFFCLGKNVQQHPELFEEIRKQGHAIGNHGMHHLDGFKSSTEDYLNDVSEASKFIHSPLFRPAYGRIKKSQYTALKKQGFQIVFWSLLTYDFDSSFSTEKRLAVIRKKTKAGSILVFHDSEKAFPQLQKELPILMEEWVKAGFQFEAI